MNACAINILPRNFPSNCIICMQWVKTREQEMSFKVMNNWYVSKCSEPIAVKACNMCYNDAYFVAADNQDMKFRAEHILWTLLKMSPVEKPICLSVTVDFPHGVWSYVSHTGLEGIHTMYKALVVLVLLEKKSVLIEIHHICPLPKRNHRLVQVAT